MVHIWSKVVDRQAIEAHFIEGSVTGLVNWHPNPLQHIVKGILLNTKRAWIQPQIHPELFEFSISSNPTLLIKVREISRQTKVQVGKNSVYNMRRDPALDEVLWFHPPSK